MTLRKPQKVAFVHDWLVSYRGGEKVLESLLELFPTAPIFTLFCEPARLSPMLQRKVMQKEVHYPSLLNKLRPVRKLLLPWLPAFIESLDLFDYDLVISSSSCVAKGIITAPSAKHICYIHSPMRYIWDQREEYLRPIQGLVGVRTAIHLLSKDLRLWDTLSAQRVDSFVANSSFVQNRVKKYYGRESALAHPPIDVERFRPGSSQHRKGDYFLAAGAFVSYKRFELAIEACERLKKPLIVAGAGPYERKLRGIAGKYTKFVISPDDGQWCTLLQEAQALLFPGVEDFGMIAVEAMASGTPVIALRKGGALDFVEEGVSGQYFEESSVDALVASLQSFRADAYELGRLLEHAEKFNKERFLRQMREEIACVMGE